ncbi:CLUMA_CG021007, isoform A [Clunio marinus]|uniref:glutathione transferase n=1 Tax=Clunio marinus TaxID=568069 RepID=A0A1J1J8J0_9DIPT|nr:CLUMA_CG021007, isoform A [Clunio marinus]
MKNLVLFYTNSSSNCRCVEAIAKTIGIDLEFKFINLYREENLNPKYLSINPIGTVPALIDGNIKVFDSHAIGIYLVEKYAIVDSLYPKDLLKRTRINQILFFEASYLFARLFEIHDSICNGRDLTISSAKIKYVERGYENTERLFSEGNQFVAGNDMTLADFSVWSTLLVLDLLIPINNQKYPKLRTYLKLLEEHPCYQANFGGAQKQADFIEKCMEKAKNYKINTFELIYPRPPI